MANQDAAFGFRPTRSLVGGQIRTEEYVIAANYGTAIYTGQVVEAVTAGGVEAAKQGHDVVMSPNSFLYFDYYQDDPKTEPIAIGGNLTLAKTYSFEPYLPELNAAEAKHVIGIQGNVWTEYIKDLPYAEYMTYPRATALSEVLWNNTEKEDYDKFQERLKVQLERFDKIGVNYRKLD